MFAGTGDSVRFVEASNGEDALALLEAFPVDLALIERNLPVVSGLEFLKTARAPDRRPELPIVIVASESSKAGVLEALKSGATDYITKPVSSEIFREKLARIPKFAAMFGGKT